MDRNETHTLSEGHEDRLTYQKSAQYLQVLRKNLRKTDC